MCESRRKLHTWGVCSVAGNSISTFLSCAILLAGNLTAFQSSQVTLLSINCTFSHVSKQLRINCWGSSADEVTQLEAIEGTLVNILPEEVEVLVIGNSRLSHWPSKICNLTRLREIRMDNNRITELPNDCINRLPELTTLSVQNNSLRFLQDGLFDGLKRLTWLSFMKNQIASIGLRVFSNRLDLPNLRKIDLAHNNLTVLEPWPLIRGQVVKGVVVDLGENSISLFTNELGWSFACGMKAPSMDLDLASNQIKHISDFTDGFNLTLMRNLLCLFGMKAHSPLNIKFVNNPINCDCIDFKIISFLKRFTYLPSLDDLRCNEPHHLAHQQLVSVMSNMEQLVCDIKNLCPPKGRCVLVPANMTLIVDASNTGLRTLPLQLPPLKTERYKYQLDFSRNSISVLDSRPYLPSDTFSLDVSRSGVETVTDEAWRDFSGINGTIRLHGNRLTTLPPMIQNVNYSFRSLTLYGNALSCACQDSWLKHWLRRYEGRLEGSDSILCQSPPWLSGRVISSVKDFEHCADPNTSRMVAIGTSTAIGILVVLVLIVFLAVNRLRCRNCK